MAAEGENETVQANESEPAATTDAAVTAPSTPLPEVPSMKDSASGDTAPTQEDAGGSMDSDALSVVSNASSRRENLRAKLRASEKRLLSLTKNTDGAPGLIGQMKAVTADLKKIEEEKSMLEVELNKLKHATDDDDFLKEKMLGIQEGFDKQVDKINSLQEELHYKEDEILRLREDLVRKLRRIVELEFDLETHSVHYTNYAKEQFKLGEEALAEIKYGDRQDFDDNASVASGNASVASMQSTQSRRSVRSSRSSRTAKSATPAQTPQPTTRTNSRKAQKLISKLLADLDDLEARYKSDKLECATQLHNAEIANEQLSTKLQVLESREKVETEEVKTNGSGTETENMQILRKRNQTLEARRVLTQKEIDRLQAEVIASKRRSQQEAREHETELDRVRMENEFLRARLKEEEAGNARKGIFKSRRRGNEQYNELESRIMGACDKIAVLEAEKSIKDRQISTLKNEVASLRMKEVANGHIDKTSFTASDSALLRSPAGRLRMYDDERSGETEGTDSSYIAELQMQLQEAQQLLVKKDQELVIERAKAASTAAGLLARITELSGTKGEGGKSGKQLPLRFYL